MLTQVQNMESSAANAAEAVVQQKTEREPVEQSKPVEPTPARVSEHSLAHFPFASRCPFVLPKVTTDPRPTLSHEESGLIVVSIDFGYCSRTDGDHNLTFLVAHDRATKFIHCIPTEHKGGKSLTYLTTELVRFMVFLGHQVVALRAGSKPATISLVDSIVQQ